MVFWLVAPVCVDGVEMTASANASAEVYGAGGVDTGGATGAMAVVAEAE